MALQRFPVGKWMSLNIFIWAIALSTHAACTDFGGLFAGLLSTSECVAHKLTYNDSTIHNGTVRREHNGRILDCYGYVLHPQGAKPTSRILV